MRDLVSNVRANVIETLRAAEYAERKGRKRLARSLRGEARALAKQFHIDLDSVGDTGREKDRRRELWERKKGSKKRFFEEHGD